MSHKKPKNRKIKDHQPEDQIAKLKSQVQTKEPVCVLDHDHINCDYRTKQNEPFSFSPANNNKASSAKKELVGDIVKSFDNHFNFSGNVINNNVETIKATTNLIQEVLLNTSSYLSDSLKDNIEVGKDFLKCRDGNDLVNFQNNLFKTNFASILDYSIKISTLMQNFATEHVNISSDFLNLNSKILYNQS